MTISYTSLEACNQLAYLPNGLTICDLSVSAESIEYEACSFTLKGKRIIYRKAKLTPKKIGYFIAIWKRLDNITSPLSSNDPFDYLVITIIDKNKHIGQFIFSKEILIKHGIVDSDNKKGKRGIRVYAPWTITNNRTALKTQKWQCSYFIYLNLDQSVIFSKIIGLMNLKGY